jgi:hypothetical protein
MTTLGRVCRGRTKAAERGRQLLHRTATGEALLATVRRDGLPQIHPIYVGVMDGRLLAFIGRSSKAIDLDEDGRYALHAHQDPAAPHEFMLRGERIRSTIRRLAPRSPRRGTSTRGTTTGYSSS